MSVELYHATAYNNISSINQNGLRESRSGRLGPGVYFASKSDAIKIAKYRQKQKNQPFWVIFKVKVKLGNCKDNGSEHDTKGSWRRNYDSCYGLHPDWEFSGIDPFYEWCVPASRCTVIDYETGQADSSCRIF